MSTITGEFEIVPEQPGPEPKRRGRKPKSSYLENINPEAGTDVALLKAEMERDIRLAEVDRQYGNDLPYDKGRTENEVMFYLNHGAVAYLEAGKRLILLKEHEGHGHFLDSLKRIDLGEDTAQRMMSTVRKLSGTGLLNTETFRHLAPSKLYEIALLEQPELEELDKTGAVGAVTRDDIERMTTRELKEALRAERQRRKQQDDDTGRMISQKNAKIDELERQVHLRPEPTTEERAQAKLSEYGTRFIIECMELKTRMEDLRGMLEDARRVPGATVTQIRQLAERIVVAGTGDVIATWEVLTDEVTNLMPTSEARNVLALG